MKRAIKILCASLFLLHAATDSAHAAFPIGRESAPTAHAAQRYLDAFIKEVGSGFIFIFPGRSMPAVSARADKAGVSYITVPGSDLASQLDPNRIKEPAFAPRYERYIFNIKRMIQAKLGETRKKTLVIVDYAHTGIGLTFFVRAVEDAVKLLGSDYLIDIRAFGIPSMTDPTGPLDKFEAAYKSGYIKTEIFLLSTDVENRDPNAPVIARFETQTQWNQDHSYRDKLYNSIFEAVAPVHQFLPMNYKATLPLEQAAYDQAFEAAVKSGEDLQKYLDYVEILNKQFLCGRYFNYGHRTSSTATCSGAIHSLLGS